MVSFFFFFNDTATTEIYTLSLHDALPILPGASAPGIAATGRFTGPSNAHLGAAATSGPTSRIQDTEDRKSTRLNSSHLVISYAVFCLKKKQNIVCKLHT